MNPLENIDDDADLDAFLDKIKYEYKDGWTEENWEEEMEKHPFFMTKVPDDNSTDLPPSVEALRQLKWESDEDTPLEKAIKLKDEGNFMFKCSKYKTAVISYQEALKQKFDDKELSSILHSNTAAAEYHLGNYRTALKNCILARKFKPYNVKAILKGAECCFQLKKFDDAIAWCDAGLNISKDDKKFLELRDKASVSKKAHDRDQRKKDKTERSRAEKEKMTLDLIKKNNIKLEEMDDPYEIFNKSFNPHQTVVHVAEDDQSLNWPVVFLYPEYGQTDFIESFNDSTIFEDHLKEMFTEPPEWDSGKQYTVKNLRVYYDNHRAGKLVKLSQKTTLLEALKSEGYIVQSGTPSFIIMVTNSNFEKMYLEKYATFHQ